MIGRARIHLSIERWRVCETWFAPSMAGVDSAGLGEVLQNVLASFSVTDRGLLVQVLVALFSLSYFPDAHHPLDDAERVPIGYARADAGSLGSPAGDGAADPPAGDAAPDRARRGSIAGRVARNGCVRADGGICGRGRDEGGVRGVGWGARAAVVGRKLECERRLKAKKQSLVSSLGPGYVGP